MAGIVPIAGGGNNIDLNRITATTADVLASKKFIDNEGALRNGDIASYAGDTEITPDSNNHTLAAGIYLPMAVTFKALQTQSKTVTPTNEQQIILPDTGKFLSRVIVNAAGSTNFACGTVANAGDLQINIPKPGGMSLNSTITNFGLVLANGTMQHTADNADKYIIALWADSDNIAADKGHFVFSWYANSKVRTKSYVDGLLIRAGSPNFRVMIDSTDEFYFDTERSYFYFVTWE